MKLIPGYNTAAVTKEAQEVLDRGGSRHMDWGGMYLYMTKSHRKFWAQYYPDMDSDDGDLKLAAFQKFLKSPSSKPYRVSKPVYFNGADLKR